MQTNKVTSIQKMWTAGTLEPILSSSKANSLEEKLLRKALMHSKVLKPLTGQRTDVRFMIIEYNSLGQ